MCPFALQSLIYLMGDDWRAYRGTIMKAFHFVDLKNMTQDFVTVGAKLCRYVERYARNGEVLDLVPTLRAATLDAIGVVAFGYDFGGVDSLMSSDSCTPAMEAFRYMLSEYTRRVFSPNQLLTNYSFPTTANKRYRAARKVVRELVADVIARRRELLQRAGGADKIHDDLLKHMMKAADGENDGEGSFTADGFTDNVMTLIFGGFDTTSAALALTMWLLSQHPQARAQLQSELDTQLPAYYSEITHDVISKLRYTRASFEEALRLHPPGGGTLRTLTQAVELKDGTILPRGTTVLAPAKSVHLNPHNWPDQPGA